MFYRSPPGSRERHQFLEKAQNSLLRGLEAEPVLRALGSSALERVRKANDLLLIPNIREGRVVTPRGWQDSDNVPFVAVRHGESVVFNAADVLPGPSQKQTIRLLIEKWASESEEDPQEAEQSLVRTIGRKLPRVVAFGLDNKNIDGMVYSPAIGVYGRELSLKRAPYGFYMNLRPALS